MPNFGPPADIRPTREITKVRGFGGFLELRRASVGSTPSTGRTDSHILELDQWTLRHKFRKVELPLSGGFGAITQRRVATSFTFSASLSWDVSALARAVSVDLFSGLAFLDDLFIGESESLTGEGEDIRLESTNRFTIAVLFALGGPEQYDVIFPGAEPAARNAHYYCDSVHLDELVIVTSTNPKNVVKMQAKGSGSAPLRRYSGLAWKGAGGFNFSQGAQKHGNLI